MPRVPMPLAVGRGLDRASGLVAVQPQYPDDARNVYARDAKMALRPGMQATGFSAVPWGTDFLAVETLKATLEIVYVLFDRDTREIRIYIRNAITGVIAPPTSPTNGLWGVVSSSADFPVVQLAESNGQMFIAHAEEVFDFRLATIYYTPNAVSPGLPGVVATMTADLNGDGVAAAVYFSGVYPYLVYLCGWGYGTETVGEGDAGDTFRISQPGHPTVFKAGTFFLAGVKKDPILDAIVADDILAILKGDETYRLVGTSPADFGIYIMDAEYGTISARVSWNVGNRAYTWSSDGARRITRDGTFPIAQPLELISPMPADFPAAGPDRLAFVAYDQLRYLLWWCFPDIENGVVPVRAFLLSLWDPQDPRWTLADIQQPVSCAGTLVTRDSTTVTPPVGYVSDVTGEDA